MLRRLMWGVVCALLLPVGATAVAGAGEMGPATATAMARAASPTVTPATGGAGVPFTTGMFSDVGAVGYQTSEFFVTGDAHSYRSDAPLTSDGRWKVEVNPATAAYTTRVLAFTPQDPRKFNGTVYVEWFNVSGGLDASPDWTHGHLQMVREGAAYVGVSAQAAGVNQLKSTGFPAPGDPVRYASLSHPGDSFSYDIYSQAAQAVHDGNVLGDLVPRRLVGVGESQSAGRLVTYIDAVHPLVDVLDGFLVHSRGRGGAALSQAPLTLIEAPLPTAIRTDSHTPVIVFQAETDVANSLLQARQEETRHGRFRLWEVAGTAHFDSYGLTIGPSDIGDGQGEVRAFEQLQNPIQNPLPGLIECALPINAGPQHWVINSAVHWINRWVKHGTPPPIAPRLQATTPPGVGPVVFASDAHGNTLGGIRTPFVDVPLATLTGVGNRARPPAFPGEVVPPISNFCAIFGQTVPFDDAKLTDLYPSHATFVLKYIVATVKAVHSRFLTLPDGLALLNAAARSDFGR